MQQYKDCLEYFAQRHRGTISMPFSYLLITLAQCGFRENSSLKGISCTDPRVTVSKETLHLIFCR
jgi:hypothetical protein